MNIIKQIQYDSFGNVLSDSNQDFEIPFGPRSWVFMCQRLSTCHLHIGHSIFCDVKSNKAWRSALDKGLLTCKKSHKCLFGARGIDMSSNREKKK